MTSARDAGWLQIPLVQPQITWVATPVSQMPSWKDARRVCLDVETRDDDLSDLGPGVRRGGYVVGVGFAIEDGPAYYLPFKHEGGGNLDESHVWSYLRDQAHQFGGELVFNNASYDLDYFWENEVPLTQKVRDVQVAEPLLDELQDTYNLNAIAARRGLPGKDERELRAHADAWGVNPKRELWRLHAGCVGAYAIQDVQLPLQILRRQEREIGDQNLGKVYELESAVTPALVRMTRRGLRVDLDEMDRVEVWATQCLQDYLDQIHHLTGVRVTSISNANQLYPALKKRGLDVPIVKHGGTGKLTPSITKLWLERQNDDVAKAIVSGREFVKLLKTYVTGFRKHMVKDRIHASFKQLHSSSDEDENEDDGARFGRCSAKHPNVHAQMKRSKIIQKRWRRVILADEGMFLYRADLSQQEPRTTVHYAELCRLPGAREAAQRYCDNPRQDSYDLMVDLCKLPRDEVKELYLGRSYGMGGGKLARKLKLPTEWRTNPKNGFTYEAAGPEAQAILDQFDRAVPYVKALARRCEEAAKARGYLITGGGRRCRFPKDANGAYEWTHKALNRLIQGCLPASTRVLTSFGYRRIGDIDRGVVWTGTSWESFTRVDRGECELAEVVLSDGKTLRCDTRHQVLVDTGKEYAFRAFVDLREGDLVCQSMAAALDFGTERLRPVDHYWMGFAIGNGSTSKGSGHPHALTLVISDRKGRYREAEKLEEAMVYFRALGFSPQKPRREGARRCVTLTVEHRDFHTLYTSWGYCWGAKAHDKRVPDTVWTATLPCRQAFLLGLLDADGWIGGDHSGAPGLHMCQRPLLEEVQTLFRSAGVESLLRHFPSEPHAFRLDLNGGMASAALGYGRSRRINVQKVEVPSHVVLEFLRTPIREPWRLTASQQVIVSRMRHGGTTSVYTLREICRASNTPVPTMYVGRKLFSKRTLGVVEPTFTLSVDSPLHRYDSEGVISKNTAADQTKTALVALDAAGYPLQLTVHDEFDYSGTDDNQAREMARIMCEALPLAVPSRVDVEKGFNYGELSLLEPT